MRLHGLIGHGASSTTTTRASDVAATPATSVLLADSTTMRANQADVGVSREKSRRRRLGRLFLMLLVPAVYLWVRIVSGDGFDITNITWPTIDPLMLIPGLFFLALIGVLVGSTVGAGRSPHVTYRPEQIDVKLDEVIGIDAVKDDVIRSLNLFLAHKTFASEMGGTANRRDWAAKVGMTERTFDRKRAELLKGGFIEATNNRGEFRLTDVGRSAIATESPLGSRGEAA